MTEYLCEVSLEYFEGFEWFILANIHLMGK